MSVCAFYFNENLPRLSVIWFIMAADFLAMPFPPCYNKVDPTAFLEGSEAETMEELLSHDWGNVDSPWIGAELSIWAVLLEGRKPVRQPAGVVIFRQEDPFANIYIVARGRVRISVLHSDGTEKHLYIACPGAMFGENACILSHPHGTTATTIVETDLYVIPSRECQRLFHSQQQIADSMLQYIARKNQMLTAQAAMLSFDRAEQRIAKTLLQLCDAYGRERPDGVLIGIRFTCTEISAIVNTSRVTANNTLMSFDRMGILTRQGGCYLIKSIDRLQELAVL